MESKKYFVALLSSYINETEPPEFDGQNVDWDLVFYLAKIHSVQVAVYLAISRLQVKPPNFEDFKAQFNMCVNVSAKQEYWMQKVIKAFTENNIKHTLVKGYVLKDYYRNSEARSFGDVDILINEEDRQKSDEVLKKLGFKFDKEHYIKEVWTYSNGMLTLEMHTKIIYKKLFNDYDYQSYFVEKAKNVELVSGYTYQLIKEDHFIYVMLHLAKHFYNCGVGIRMLMDIAVFLNKQGKSMDFDYINSELKKIKLSEFANCIFDLCKKMFDIDLNENNNSYIENEHWIEIMDYILNHGVFGFDNKNIRSITFHKNDSNEKKSVLILLLNRIFPNYDTMNRTYYWFRNCPKIFLPYGWVRRIFIQLTNEEKRHVILEKFDIMRNVDMDAEKHNKLLKIVGLK